MEPQSDEESKTYPSLITKPWILSQIVHTQHKSRRCPLKDKKIKSLQSKIDESP